MMVVTSLPKLPQVPRCLSTLLITLVHAQRFGEAYITQNILRRTQPNNLVPKRIWSAPGAPRKKSEIGGIRNRSHGKNARPFETTYGPIDSGYRCQSNSSRTTTRPDKLHYTNEATRPGLCFPPRWSVNSFLNTGW
ncbi:hypothetical protein BGZ63DRAFT_179003 [Mariannaea sp. PMI_226]|nr:hypothetical protein BGZ63DRAFT_179003 [Mariannaea sp. PMI_226]